MAVTVLPNRKLVILDVIHRAEKSIYVSWGNKQNQRKNLFLIKSKPSTEYYQCKRVNGKVVNMWSEASHYLNHCIGLKNSVTRETKKDYKTTVQHNIKQKSERQVIYKSKKYYASNAILNSLKE